MRQILQGTGNFFCIGCGSLVKIEIVEYFWVDLFSMWELTATNPPSQIGYELVTCIFNYEIGKYSPFPEIELPLQGLEVVVKVFFTDPRSSTHSALTILASRPGLSA